jgi:hypothetical protein
MTTLDPAVRDLLVAAYLALQRPWIGDQGLPERIASVQGALQWTALFGDPARELRYLERTIEQADAGRVRRHDALEAAAGGGEAIE